MKTKIQIKSIFGSVIFELEKENNTIKDTLIEAIKLGSDLSGSDLSGSDLRGSDLSGSDLRDSDLSGSDLRDSNLSGSDLRGSDLRGSDLRGSDLSGSDLRGSDLSDSNLRGSNLRGSNGEKITIKKAIVITGMYQYLVIPFISENNEKWLKLGCHTRKIEDWESDFWNNHSEFPNDGSEKSELRLLAFEYAKMWFKLMEKYENNY